MTDDKNEQTSDDKRTKLQGLARTLWVHDGMCLFNCYPYYAAIKKAKYYGCTYIVGELDYLDYRAAINKHRYMWLEDSYDIEIIEDQRNLKVLWRLKL